MECYSFTKPGRLHLKNGEKNQDQLFGIRSRDRIAVCLSDGCSTASHGLAAAQQIVTLTARMFYEQFYDLLLDDPEAPVVWRGPVIAGAVKQFWQDVVWDVDFLFVDMPPGTGDVPLTVFQTLPVDGIVIVSSPQELVGMIVGKAVQMAKMMNVPILGLVENMSYAVCPDCGKHINVFGDSHVDEIADKYKLPVLAKMPIDPELAKEADAGMIEMFAGDYLDNAAQTVAKLLKK